jgi:hypothetical protein
MAPSRELARRGGERGVNESRRQRGYRDAGGEYQDLDFGLVGRGAVKLAAARAVPANRTRPGASRRRGDRLLAADGRRRKIGRRFVAVWAALLRSWCRRSRPGIEGIGPGARPGREGFAAARRGAEHARCEQPECEEGPARHKPNRTLSASPRVSQCPTPRCRCEFWRAGRTRGRPSPHRGFLAHASGWCALRAHQPEASARFAVREPDVPPVPSP